VSGKPRGALTQLAQNLRKARAKADLSLESAGFAADITKDYLSALECGKRIPSIQTLGMLAIVYECALSLLLAKVPPYEVIYGPKRDWRRASERRARGSSGRRT